MTFVGDFFAVKSIEELSVISSCQRSASRHFCVVVIVNGVESVAVAILGSVIRHPETGKSKITETEVKMHTLLEPCITLGICYHNFLR